MSNSKVRHGNSYNKKRGQRQNKTWQEDKNERRGKEIIDTEIKESGFNDVSWYTLNTNILNSAATFPFALPLGSKFNVSINDPQSGTRLESIPGVCAINFMPTIGIATDANSPINVASRAIYTFVRHANSGSKVYDAPDLMMYLVAMDSLLMLHAYIRRIYGVVSEFSPLNRYYARGLLTAMGVDPDNMFANAAQLRYLVNMTAVRIGQLCVPNSMSYYARHQWMCEGMYLDGTANQSQTYVYVPYGFYQYVIDEETKVGKLQFRTRTGLGMKDGTITSLQNAVNTLLNAVLQQEDCGIMSGDILKAFGENGIMKLSVMPDNYFILPVLNYEVLSQIENSVAVGHPQVSGPISYDIEQATAIGTGYLTQSFSFPAKYTPLTTGSPSFNLGRIANKPYLMNFHKGEVSPGDVMVASRLLPTFATYSGGDTFDLLAYGSELVISYMYYKFNDEVSYGTTNWNGVTNSDLSYMEGFNVTPETVNLTETADVLTAYNYTCEYLPVVSQFDWHPLVWTQSSVSNYTMRPMMDLENFSLFSSENLQRLHEVAMLAEFSVSEAGFTNLTR